MDGKSSETAGLKLEGVTKRFGNVTAVDNVSLDVPHGKLITLLGPSGCGKTTILRMIAGLEVPTSGFIFLGGQDITRLPANERRITMVFQSYALFPHMNVYENIAYGLKIVRMPEEKIREVIGESLEMVGLAGLEKRGPSELSGGQQQRVAVARALVLKPKVLLFDEPLSNLDAKLRKRMRGEIRDLQKDLGITSVYVTHDQAEALAISDRIIVMETAAVSQEGSPEELYKQPANPFVADFIGEANIFDVHIIKVDQNTARIHLGGLDLSAPFHKPPKEGDSAKFIVRPEDVRIGDAADTGLAGTIKFAFYQGATNDYTVDTEVGEIRAYDYETKEILREKGERVSLTFREDHVFLISR